MRSHQAAEAAIEANAPLNNTSRLRRLSGFRRLVRGGGLLFSESRFRRPPLWLLYCLTCRELMARRTSGFAGLRAPPNPHRSPKPLRIDGLSVLADLDKAVRRKEAGAAADVLHQDSVGFLIGG